MIALFFYSLMPIVRNTLTGLQQIPENLRETSEVLNLSSSTQLKKIELPLALPATFLALLCQWGFDLLEKRIVSSGLRL
jgi:ABC-type proline/glycine betaine transport system permease subunit